MSEPASIPVSEEARRTIEQEAAKRGLPVQAYMEERLGLRSLRPRRGLGSDGESRGGGLREYMDSMRDFAEMAPTLLMMRMMGMGGMAQGMMGGETLTRKDVEELVEARRRPRDEDDDEDPVGRKMEKMALRRMNYKLYAQMLGGDTDEGKAAQRMADKYDLEIKELRKAYEETKEQTSEKLEAEKEERHRAEMEARDRELQALRDDYTRIQEQMNTRQEPPAPWAQMKDMAASLIAAKEAWGSVEKSFQSPPPPPGKEAPLVEKLGHVLDRGANAAKDFLVGMGALQAGQRGIPPSEIGQVPPPPMPGPIPQMPVSMAPPQEAPPPSAAPVAPSPPPRAGPPLIAAPAEPPAEVYYDGEGNPVSQQEFAAATRSDDRET